MSLRPLFERVRPICMSSHRLGRRFIAILHYRRLISRVTQWGIEQFHNVSRFGNQLRCWLHGTSELRDESAILNTDSNWNPLRSMSIRCFSFYTFGLLLWCRASEVSAGFRGVAPFNNKADSEAKIKSADVNWTAKFASWVFVPASHS